ncbi:MAG TPA: hypothetical protein VGN25_01595 [Solirubrobacteraceae bacterium]|jgi:hypothetical protein|nr:hypothetical protein [Solirubrobacteraceae bacterium]
MSARSLLTALCAACVLAPASASAAGRSHLSASFAPEKLGAATTVGIGFQLKSGAPPLSRLQLRLPTGVTAGFNTLGLETCTQADLEAKGASACPPNALVGLGHAVVSFPLGSQQLAEPVSIKMFMAPATGGHTVFLFYADGNEPVIDRLVFQSVLFGESGPFGGRLDTAIPPVAGLPGSPDASVVSMHAEIGPKSLRYYTHSHGKTVVFTPEGFDVPARCPRGGFPFSGTFTFADGSEETAAMRVPCPGAGR